MASVADTVEELLLDTLEDLVDSDDEDELERFKFYLKNHIKIPKKNLRKSTSREKIVQVLVEYNKEDAVHVTIKALRKMSKNELANQLEQNSVQLSQRHQSQNPGKKQLGRLSGHLASLTLSCSSAEKPKGPEDSLRTAVSGRRLRKYACSFSLDPNTANEDLILSEDLHSVSCVDEDEEESEEEEDESEEDESEEEEEERKQYLDHKEMFKECNQVLSSKGLTGRRYWEVEWKGGKEGALIEVAASYKGIKRKGGKSQFGNNNKSWCLRIDDDEYYVCHDNNSIRLKVKVGEASNSEDETSDSEDEAADSKNVSSGRVGVCLDWEAGFLFFYEVGPGGAVSHLHTFSCSFTEPLFPGFGLSPGDSVTVVKP